MFGGKGDKLLRPFVFDTLYLTFVWLQEEKAQEDERDGEQHPHPPGFIQPAPVHMEVDYQVDNIWSLTESLIDRKSYHLVHLGGLINIYLYGFKRI